MTIYVKVDETTKISERQLVEELWDRNPGAVLDGIRGDTEENAPPAKNTRLVAVLVNEHAFSADVLVDGFLRGIDGPQHRARVAELVESIAESVIDFGDAGDQEAMLKTLLEDARFSAVVLGTALWESHKFKDLAELLARLLSLMLEHCDDDEAMATMVAPRYAYARSVAPKG